MEYNLIDTHTHLTCDRLYPRYKEILASAKEAGFKHIIVVCTNKEEFLRAKHVKREYPNMISIAFGYHPEDAKRVDAKDLSFLEECIKAKELVAVGEIGLDYYYEPYDEEKQKTLFLEQIKLANLYHLPILIHMRDATKDTLEMININCKTKFLMHCFSGSVETAKIVLKMQGYISFAGPLTFKNARGLLDVAKVVPIDRVFVESDAPYLTPHPFRGKENETKYVGLTFEKLSELTVKDRVLLANQMEVNFCTFFGVEL